MFLSIVLLSVNWNSEKGVALILAMIFGVGALALLYYAIERCCSGRPCDGEGSSENTPSFVHEHPHPNNEDHEHSHPHTPAQLRRHNDHQRGVNHHA